MDILLPKQVVESREQRPLIARGFRRVQRGKVRDIYTFPRGLDNLLLMIATDRVSIFDFVLPALVPHKGEVLTALTHFWHITVLPNVPHHLLQTPLGNMAVVISRIVPEVPSGRSLVVYQTEIPPYEVILRYHIGGSRWKEYKETGVVAGQKLPHGLQKWEKLESPLFTPSTKEMVGHDKPLTAREYFARTGERGRAFVEMCRGAYERAYAYAEERGILILDTKFEGLHCLADEVLTPDSSRFTTRESFVEAIEEGKDPVPLDKQVMRNWGLTIETPWGVPFSELDPENRGHQKFVHGLTIPPRIIAGTTNAYLEIFSRLTSYSLEEYQRNHMHIS